MIVLKVKDTIIECVSTLETEQGSMMCLINNYRSTEVFASSLHFSSIIVTCVVEQDYY